MIGNSGQNVKSAMLGALDLNLNHNPPGGRENEED